MSGLCRFCDLWSSSTFDARFLLSGDTGRGGRDAGGLGGSLQQSQYGSEITEAIMGHPMRHLTSCQQLEVLWTFVIWYRGAVPFVAVNRAS